MVSLTEPQLRALLAALGGGAFCLLLALEVLTEPDDLSLLDVVADGLALLLTILSAVGVALLAQRMAIQHVEKMTLLKELQVARSEGQVWRSRVQSNIEGIQLEMERQFSAWGMTPAECDVGLLILKGMNHKEIAALRGTSDATVRQQAQAIYRKAGLPGRTAFAAYFLEDLMAPPALLDRTASAPTHLPA